ncbi:hypothetical protein SAY87_012472 [Trapa incisa]|uniref:Lipoxygenase n=1 Tax=Trapa incisa TaxID=236973 RepID=A0AAN7GPF5_9MYRT|nr:hypothetical protein SAY87_012472 [Trapa incisa]
MSDSRSVKTVAGEKGIKKMKCEPQPKTVKGTVVLGKPAPADLATGVHFPVDWFHELLGHRVSLQLISADTPDPENKLTGRLGKPAHLQNWIKTFPPWKNNESAFDVTFDWDDDMGVPGAFLIRNNHQNEFLLKRVTIENVPDHGHVHFICDSWVYPADPHKRDRIFFANKAYLPHETPEPLLKFREEELQSLRGDGTGERKVCDRIYDYDCYNDLCEPGKGTTHVRPILGGSVEYPYPRRGRTGRPPAKEDDRFESRIPLLNSMSIYVPRDERFGQIKMSDLLAFSVKSIIHFLKPGIEGLCGDGEFNCLADIMELYEGGIKIPKGHFAESFRESIPSEMLKEIFRPDGDTLFKFPKPHVIRRNNDGWGTDEEFAREMLAGVDPNVICRLKEFPPESKLNPGNNLAFKEYLEKNLCGQSICEAIASNKLFILDHYDTLMPYLRWINETSTKTYATRTLLFLKDDGTLKPLAIELSLPHPDGDEFGVISNVLTPTEEEGAGRTLWKIAKAYVSANDSGYHQLISHWLKTHAVIEPFIIATNRQLSVLHPIHKLLHPHFRDTMNINAFARQILISAGGALEMTVFSAKYSLEMSSAVYKDWVFPDQALPADLIKRGMAVEDEESRHGVRLLIEDYPFAVDGLEIWSAIKEWVREYCSFYYKNDDAVLKDPELQQWWKELREVGHGDLKDKPWWPRMESREELIETCTIIIWVASALHAAINFGQYPYGGYMPNRPAATRRLLPEEGTPDYEELTTHPEKAFLKTVTPQPLTVLGISLVEILSKHSADEVYLGKRDPAEWTADEVPREAFRRFGERLEKIEKMIEEMNGDPTKWRNRTGPVEMPYTLLYPSSEVGLTAKGIPNSISI